MRKIAGKIADKLGLGLVLYFFAMFLYIVSIYEPSALPLIIIVFAYGLCLVMSDEAGDGPTG